MSRRAGGTHLVVVEVEAVEVVELIEVSVGVVVVGRRHRRDGGPQPLGVPRVVGDELGLAAELGLHVVVGGGRRSAEVDRQPRLVRPPRVEPAAHDGDVAVPGVDQPAARHAADGARVAREDERRVGRRRQLRHVVGKVGVEAEERAARRRLARRHAQRAGHVRQRERRRLAHVEQPRAARLHPLVRLRRRQLRHARIERRGARRLVVRRRKADAGARGDCALLHNRGNTNRRQRNSCVYWYPL